MIFSLRITEEPIQYCIPNYADLLVFQATYEGQYAFRSVSIVNEMSNHRHIFTNLMRMVYTNGSTRYTLFSCKEHGSFRPCARS